MDTKTIIQLINSNYRTDYPQSPESNIFVVVPKSIQDTMNKIASDPSIGGNEFGMYLKYKLEHVDGKLIYIVSDSYILPKQEVTAVAINFLEGREDFSYNAVIHRHPEGCDMFSSVDDTSINCNFDLSLLYMKTKGIFLANVNFHFDIEGLSNVYNVRTSNIIII